MSQLECALNSRSLITSGVMSFDKNEILWAANNTNNKKTFKKETIQDAQWKYTSKGYQLRLFTADGNVTTFVGFGKENLPFLSSLFQQDYNVNIKDIAVSTRGHNWGDFTVKSQLLSYNSPDGEEIFSLNMTDVKNCQVQPKNQELILDLHTNEKMETKEDMVVQVRFVYPKDDAEEKLNDMKEKILPHVDTTVQETGESICVLEKLPFIVPRGKYNVEIFDKFMRLSGGTHLFKVNFQNIHQMYLLPKPGGTHMYFVITLEQPLRLTRKPLYQLLFLFEKSQIISSDSPLKLNLTSEELEEYKGKGIQNKMSGPLFEVVAKVFRAFSGKKIIGAGSFSSFENESAIKCSHKANEGHIFFLEKSIFFLYKPIIYCRHEELKSLKFSRANILDQGSRFFDFILYAKNGQSYTFQNIEKNEYDKLVEFLKNKSIKIENEMQQQQTNVQQLIEANVIGLDEDSDEEDDDFEGGHESSSEDEDFVGEESSEPSKKRKRDDE